MKTFIISTAAVLAASSALAQTTKSPGASSNAPGQQMQNTTKPSTAPGASEYAPGHQTNTTAGPGHSESAPGQKMQNTTGSSTKNTGSSTKKY
ncbi:hypothetical protein [Bradyrhizobium sp. WSM1743]|uniref:hypothetical protein n=1 Tax=Bradyrhizobium sp. WSM1743 TaxID=318996 RepID=UPI0004895C92|nr:hypothetical protein [Bradyrhizobium sp. WSM1743]